MTTTDALLSVIVSQDDWRTQGSCVNHPTPDLWFEGDREWKDAARQICRGCPVRNECLEYALESFEPHGIWGSLTRGQRDRLRRGAA